MSARVLVVGVGGLGCPAAWALAKAGIARIGLCDDDDVDRTNLHRQILFSDVDVGCSKLDAAARALRDVQPTIELELHRRRLLPDTAERMVRNYDLVLEGADNFATKFLAADACSVAGVPVVHASAVRWVGTAFAVGSRGRPCYRCVFEDPLSAEDAPNCSDAGVMGPVVGVVAAIQADLALALLGGRDVAGQLVTFDGRTEALRRWRPAARPDCPLCGSAPRIRHIDPETYASPAPCAS
jgi:molybdopterin/thiamine biosynthesis adenylyltransferase